MSSRGVILFFSIMIAAVISMTACDMMSEKQTLDESIAPYLELESITGGETASIVVNRGSAKNFDSYLTFEITDDVENTYLRKSVNPAWCVEWDKAIAQDNDTHDGVEFFSTYGSDKWRPVNYLLSQQESLKQEFPGIDYKEIQVALWSLIENPVFDLDKVLSEGKMPSRLMSNGVPNFDITAVREIINKVRQNYQQYQYKPSTPFFAYTKTAANSQNGGFLTCDETAWAANGDTPGDFRYNEEKGNWATYVEYNGVAKTVTLFAGQTNNIGTVTFSAPTGGKVTITINLNDDGDFRNVSENVKIQDYAKAPSGNPQIGLFDHKGDATGKSFSIEVPENKFYGVHVDALTECDDEEDDGDEDDEDEDDD